MQLAGRGYDLLLTARRQEQLQELAVQIETARGVSVEVVVADLASDAGREMLAERVRSAPSLALLINNAGFGSVGLFHKASLEVQDQMHRVHVLSVIALSHAALNNFADRNWPAGSGIINISSVASFGQSPSNVSYCASKAWLTSFTEGLAIELAGLGFSGSDAPVKVQALCPGFTYSEFHDRIGMSRDPIPKSLWMSAEFVVSESLRGFDRGELIVIPNWRYKAIAAFMRTMPGAVMRKIATVMARRYRKPVAEVK